MRTHASLPARRAFSALVMTNATAPSASMGHSSACSGSVTIFEFSTWSTVSVLSLYIALGFSRDHSRSATQTDAMSAAVEPLAAM